MHRAIDIKRPLYPLKKSRRRRYQPAKQIGQEGAGIDKDEWKQSFPCVQPAVLVVAFFASCQYYQEGKEFKQQQEQGDSGVCGKHIILFNKGAEYVAVGGVMLPEILCQHIKDYSSQDKRSRAKQ